MAVSGGGKPWILAQVAAGAPAKNALTIPGQRPIVAATPVVSYASAVPAQHHGVYYGKRQAPPYTLGQVASGLTNGGVITNVARVPGNPYHAHVAAAVPADTYDYNFYGTYIRDPVAAAISHIGK